MSKFISETINIYDNCDVKQPVLLTQHDFRTTYTRGHDHFVAPVVKTSTVQNQKLKEYPSESKSVTAAEFGYKYPENYLPKADLPYNNQRVQYNKIASERISSLPPRPINQYVTVNSIEYTEKLPKFSEFSVCKQNSGSQYSYCVPKYEIHPVIFPNQNGYQRLLDMYATTNSLSFSKHKTPQRDYITAWNWIGIDKRSGCELGHWKIPQKIETSQRVARFAKPRVPNRGGLKSEVSTNYRNPVLSNYELETNLKLGD